jgi:methyl-accepting chemotaxis protein
MRKGVWLTLSALVVVLAVAATGCGGSDKEEDPTTAWASGFCRAITSWTDDLKDISSQFSNTSNLNQDALQSAVDDVRSSTERLGDDLRALGTPPTDSGQEVQDAIDGLSTMLDNETAKIEDTADGVNGLADLPGAISTITKSLGAISTAFSDTLTTIRSADVNGELKTAIDDSPDCQALNS